MLVQLHIKDLAIIDEVELSPGTGLNVLTGETGAGKSIIVGAVELLRGARASATVVRAGADEAVVEGVFDLTGGCGEALAALEEAGLPVEGSELLVRRSVSASGRGRVHVNGALCTVGILARITGRLVEISGQHEHQALSDAATHRRILDGWGVPAATRAAMAEAHETLRSAAAALQRCRMNDRERAERVDFLAYQLEELEAAALQPGEEDELGREQRRLAAATELLSAATQGEEELYSGDGAMAGRLRRLADRLGHLSGADAALEPLASQLQEAAVLVEDAGSSLGRYAAGLDVDPVRLDAVEQRQAVLHRLVRKHGATTTEILARADTMRRELDELADLDRRLAALERELEAARQAAVGAARALSQARQRAAGRLSRAVTKELAGLRMKGARLAVAVTPAQAREGDDPALCVDGRRIGRGGWDRVALLIAANPGEDPRELRRVASGGELSRVMLALRKGLGEHDPVPTVVYDEVDAGVGGAVADVVGRYLAQVAAHRQVLCVTHLPQVAVHAAHHFHVGKEVVSGRARTGVQPLDERTRVEEIARMLGGEQVSRQARANARQLMASARLHPRA